MDFDLQEMIEMKGLQNVIRLMKEMADKFTFTADLLEEGDVEGASDNLAEIAYTCEQDFL